MKCTPVPGGFVCGPRPRRPVCSACGKAPGVLLCDGPAPASSKRKTCDARLCRGCAKEVGPNRHLCPPCAVGPQQRSLL